MKKMTLIFVIFAFAVLLIPYSTFAQSGLKGGIMMSTVTGLDLGDIAVETKQGFVAGYASHKAFNPSFGLTTEILFSQYGFAVKVDDEDTGEEVEVTLTFNYIELPILLKYTFGSEESKIRPNIYGGASAMYFISGKMEAAGESEDLEGKDMNSFNYGIAFGGGVEISSFFFDFRLYMGLSKLGKEESGYITPDIKHSAYSVTAGISF